MSGEGEDAAPDDGVEAAAAALGRARRAAEERGIRPGTRPRPRRGGASLPGATSRDARDPELVASTLGRVLAERGWTASLSVGSVVGRWREVVGDQIADHCAPETFDGGRLVVRTTSTAWATQLKLLLPQLERRLAAEVGEGVVEEITVLGPGGPSWRRGPRSVPGRGPRDTYG
ncbi:protein of unknown function DUF721 [Beutenbergia cavernae DSM 12333]|uniref:Uncharacterized protein n=1 Tax=Beutenbergia cavernae (strain ATCC BAA-8 / DSM 12333 / CCUG 43141 / JCM 11478 / NBRC 16432 / NCIMB 13614 / HKI 0122) TaxID=471853 RepID=C5BUP7_BEUC1|nr:protein of unknown function DUF721 [Beutenbergia cavernae DSM 12333]